MASKFWINRAYEVLRHWEDNVVESINGFLYYGYSQSAEDCAFCIACKVRGYVICDKCPICYDTQKLYCHETPHETVDVYNEDTVWEEFMYLLNVCYSQGLESKYMEEL